MLGRILVTWTLVICAAVVSAADLSHANLADIPQCGRRCIVTTVLEKSSCSITDFHCICADAALSREVESCVSTDCSPRDALKTAGITKHLCGAPRRNKSLVVWLVPLLNVVVSTIFYLSRLLCRAILRQRIDAGDITLGVSVALSFPILWVAFKLTEHGMGRDAWDIPPDNITHILYLYWWAELFYQAGLPLIRISILCFLLKIFPQDYIRWAAFTLIGLNAADLIAFVAAGIFQCYPIHGAWTFWDGSFDGHCTNLYVQSWIQAGVNIFLDLLVIILPLPPLARLTASKAKKLQIIIMFSVGFTVTIISVLRLRTLVVFANTINISYDYVDPGLYSFVELSAGIICACLPAVRALLGLYAPGLFAPTRRASIDDGPKDECSRQRSQSLAGRNEEPHRS